jgi:hypothetical protein
MLAMARDGDESEGETRPARPSLSQLQIAPFHLGAAIGPMGSGPVPVIFFLHCKPGKGNHPFPDPQVGHPFPNSTTSPTASTPKIGGRGGLGNTNPSLR